MGDEDGSQELPQRSRGPARGGSDRSASSASPVLSEELRQRIQAAVKAERAEAAAKERPTTTERSMRETVSASADSGVAGPAVNGIGGARKHGQPERAVRNGTAVKAPPATDRPASHKAAATGHGRTPARGRTSQPGHPEVARKQSHDRRLTWVPLVAMAVVLGAVGSLITVMSLHLTSSSAGNSGVPAAVMQHQEALARGQAASWVTQQVNPDALVSCDQVMCHALKAAGFRGKLLTLGPTSPPPVTSAVVVVTQAVRDLFGSSIGSAWAPAVLASVGSGAAEVTIRVVAPHGAVAYQEQLKSGLTDRTQNGQALEGNSQINLSASAKANLAAGQVDPRLLLALTYLAGDEPIDVEDFGNVGPGASPGLLLRYADLNVDGKAANLTSPAYVQALRASLSKANPQFRPTSSQTVVLPGGDAFRVAFTGPSPLTPVSSSP